MDLYNNSTKLLCAIKLSVHLISFSQNSWRKIIFSSNLIHFYLWETIFLRAFTYLTLNVETPEPCVKSVES